MSTGRPPKHGTKKNNVYKIRMTDEEMQMLENCSEKFNMLKADVIRKGIENMYSIACSINR